MRLLDLFCCQGGASKGYKDAGFDDVWGVDMEVQRRYPYHFILGDAIKTLLEVGESFDFIHASPPCQGYSNLTPASHKDKYPKLIYEVRSALRKIGKPYCIENVPGARHELRDPLMLCGSMFGLRTQRHRYFEVPWLWRHTPEWSLPKCDHSRIPLLVTTASKASRERRAALGMTYKSVKNAPQAYGIDWMTCDGLKECIPPAYTQWIGSRWIQLQDPAPSKGGGAGMGEDK